MSVISTLLLFGGIPASVVVLVAVLVYAAGGRHIPRYRPGRPYTFAPVWYLAAAPPGTDDGSGPIALPAHSAQPALPAGGTPAVGTPGTELAIVERGGARGTW